MRQTTKRTTQPLWPKKLQNPVGDLYSFPFQNNTNFNYGPHKGTQDILNVQPVIPIHVNEDWNVITRTILPLIWQPSLRAGPHRSVRHRPDHVLGLPLAEATRPMAGCGPSARSSRFRRSATRRLGSNVWGAGPTAAVVYMKGPWVTGVLANNVWSLGGTSGPGGTRYNNVPGRSPSRTTISARAGTSAAPRSSPPTGSPPGNKAWTLPFGAQVGRVVKIGGKLPVNFLVGAYYNALRPEFGSTWQLRTQVTIIF